MLTLGRDTAPGADRAERGWAVCRGPVPRHTHTDLGLAEAPAEPPKDAAVRETSPEKSQRLYQQFVVQTGGVNFGQDNQITIGRDVIGTQEIIDASSSKGFIYKPTARWSRSSATKSVGIRSLAIKSRR